MWRAIQAGDMYSWLDLGSNETVLHAHHPTIWRTIPSIIAALIGAIAGIVVIIHPEVHALADVNFTLLGLGMIALSIVTPIAREIRRRSVVYVVTSKQIILKRGILSEHTDPIPHTRIVDFHVQRSPVDRMLGKGDIQVSTAGSDGDDIRFGGIPHCNRIKSTLNEQVKIEPHRGGTTAATP